MNSRYSCTISHLRKLSETLNGEIAKTGAIEPEGLGDLAFQETDLHNLRNQLEEVNSAIDLLRKVDGD